MISSGYVIADSTAIYGIGDTPEEVIEDYNTWADEVYGSSSDTEAVMQAATRGLLEQIALDGGCIAWDKVDGVCCTIEEAEEYYGEEAS